jgi:hypothetical protein
MMLGVSGHARPSLTIMLAGQRRPSSLFLRQTICRIVRLGFRKEAAPDTRPYFTSREMGPFLIMKIHQTFMHFLAL